MRVIPRKFFAGEAPEVARALLGCILVHDTSDGSSAGRIVEVEAYDESDAASHSFRGPTQRNRAMFGPGGISYVYRSYGIHWCMNVTCGAEGHGAAVLLRALEPVEGADLMASRRGLVVPYKTHLLCRGPGNLCRAMGITGVHDHANLRTGTLRIERGSPVADEDVIVTPRIGITKAADAPWRFLVRGCAAVSGRKGVRSSPAT